MVLQDLVKKHYIPTSTMFTATKLGRVKSNTLYLHYYNVNGHQSWQSGYLKWGPFLYKVIRSLDHVILQGYISTPTKTTATTLGRAVTYNKDLPFIKSQHPLIMWFCKVMWQIKYLISLLPQGLLPLNVAKCSLIMRSIHP